MRKLIYAFVLIASLAVLSSSSSSYVTTSDPPVYGKYYMACCNPFCSLGTFWSECITSSWEARCPSCQVGWYLLYWLDGIVNTSVCEQLPPEPPLETLYTYYWWCPNCWNQWFDDCVPVWNLSDCCPYCFEYAIECTYWTECD